MCQAKIGRDMHQFHNHKIASLKRDLFIFNQAKVTAAAVRVKALVDGSPVAVSSNIITANSSVHTQV